MLPKVLAGMAEAPIKIYYQIKRFLISWFYPKSTTCLVAILAKEVVGYVLVWNRAYRITNIFSNFSHDGLARQLICCWWLSLLFSTKNPHKKRVRLYVLNMIRQLSLRLNFWNNISYKQFTLLGIVYFELSFANFLSDTYKVFALDTE